MARNNQKNGMINFLILLALGVAGFVVARYANSMAGPVAAVYIGMGSLVALISWFQMGLEERERLEKLEFDEVTRSHTSANLFNTQDAETFPARRAREQFERFFIPGFTVVLFLVQGLAAWF